MKTLEIIDRLNLLINKIEIINKEPELVHDKIQHNFNWGVIAGINIALQFIKNTPS